MINMIKDSGLSHKPVLSHYPKEYEAYTNGELSDDEKSELNSVLDSFIGY